MKVETTVLYEGLKKVKKLVGTNDVIEVCDYIEIICKNNELILTSTNMTNFITVSLEVDTDEEFQAVVEGEKLIKLVSNTTKDTITMVKKETYVEFKGNGNYKLEIIDDFPEYEIEPDDILSVEAGKIQYLIDKHKGTYSDDMDKPHLTGYYIRNNVETIDGIRMAISDINLFDKEVELLIPSEFMDLLGLFDDEDELQFMVSDNMLLVSNNESNLQVYGGMLHGVDNFPSLDIFADVDYDNFVEVNSDNLKEVLKRLELFVDDGGCMNIMLNDEDKMLGLSVKEKAKEEIHTESCKGSLNIHIDINNLQVFNKNIDSDFIKLMYNEENSHVIKIIGDEDTNYYCALMREGE